MGIKSALDAAAGSIGSALQDMEHGGSASDLAGAGGTLIEGLVRIELRGPSGVGKSTLGRALLASEESRDALAPIGGLTDLASVAPPRRSATSPHDAAHRELLRRKCVDVLSRGLTAMETSRLIGFMAANLSEDVHLSCVTAPVNVLRSDGVLHNFGALVLELGRQDHELVQDLLRNRVILECTAPPEVITERVLARERAGDHRPKYRGRSSAEVAEQVAASIERSRSITEGFRRLGVIVGTIDVEQYDRVSFVALLKGLVLEARGLSEADVDGGSTASVDPVS